MFLKIAANTGERTAAMFKIKRAAIISAIVAGIIFVGVSIGMISYLYLSVFAMNRHLDPATPGMISVGGSAMLMIFGIAKFFTADQAWGKVVS
jgi:hypothetical protein